MTDQRVRMVCGTVLIVVAVSIVLWSDMYLRPAAIPGTDPRSWDIVGTILLGLGIRTFWRADQNMNTRSHHEKGSM